MSTDPAPPPDDAHAHPPADAPAQHEEEGQHAQRAAEAAAAANLPTEFAVVTDARVAELEAADLEQIGVSVPTVQLNLTLGSPIAQGGKVFAAKRLITTLPADVAFELGRGLAESAEDALRAHNAHPALDLSQSGLRPATPAEAAALAAEADRQARERSG